MARLLVLTAIGVDRPGLVELLSKTVAEHGGNWLESRMSRLAGQFAGILLASVPDERADALAAALRALEARGLRVVVEPSAGDDAAPDARRLVLELVGDDRPGIVREVSRVLAAQGVNVDELETECSSAPMSGEILFRARARLRVPAQVKLSALRESLEQIANDLMVEIALDESSAEE